MPPVIGYTTRICATCGRLRTWLGRYAVQCTASCLTSKYWIILGWTAGAFVFSLETWHVYCSPLYTLRKKKMKKERKIKSLLSLGFYKHLYFYLNDYSKLLFINGNLFFSYSLFYINFCIHYICYTGISFLYSLFYTGIIFILTYFTHFFILYFSLPNTFIPTHAAIYLTQ